MESDEQTELTSKIETHREQAESSGLGLQGGGIRQKRKRAHVVIA